MENMGEDKATVTKEDLDTLIGHFAKESFKCSSSGTFGSHVMEKCLSLIQLDYKFTVIDNSKGRFNDQYPDQIPIMTQEKFPRTSRASSNSVEDCFTAKGNGNRKRNSLGAPPTSNRSSPELFAPQSPKLNSSKNDEDNEEDVTLETLINQAKLARCRNRFVVPVIFYQGKYICRSSTIARLTEIGIGTLTNKGITDTGFYLDTFLTLDDKRKSDVDLLNKWKVGTIIDLMVENEKQKYLISVTSSEKIDDTRKYSCFRIVPTPYPGCEFFLDFKKNNYNPEGLLFNWSAPPIDSALKVKPNPAIDQLNIDWSKYKEWDLKQLTENYLCLMLKYVWCSSKGILIHCISGWDRTPMFISLLRMSLWADGVIHKSLSPSQMLYLTLAYDWYLFGHNLENRLEKGEDIMHFCFHFLKYIYSDDFKTPNTAPAVTAPNSPIYSSSCNDFDLSEIDQLNICSRNYDSNEDLSNGKGYDTLDDSMQFEFDRPDANKLKSVKKQSEKFSISETIYEMDDFEHHIVDEFSAAEEIETKRYKSASPRKRNRSFKLSEFDSDDEFDILTEDDKNMASPNNLPAAFKNVRARTISNSSEIDVDWGVVTQTGSLNGTDYLSEYKNLIIPQREIKLRSVRDLFYKTYSAYGYKTERSEGILSKLSFILS